MIFPVPVVEEHEGILVVRDDLIPGGTKSRYLLPLFEQYPHRTFAYSFCDRGD